MARPQPCSKSCFESNAADLHVWKLSTNRNPNPNPKPNPKPKPKPKPKPTPKQVDYMAMECLPLMLNDEMVFPYANVLDWARFSVHMRKREIPQLAARLRNISAAAQDAMHEVARRYKRGFVWWRPEGLAYEFTLAALGQRVASLGLAPAHGRV